MCLLFHEWIEPSAEEKKNIREALKPFGIIPHEIKVCMNCYKIKIRVTCLVGSIHSHKVVLPPFPKKEA